MSELITITMKLTDRDFINTEKLSKKLNTHSKAEAVSAALSITTSLSELLEGEKELIIRNKQGDIEKVIIPGLTKESA
jgi:ADP-ribosylglycohydrolase